MLLLPLLICITNKIAKEPFWTNQRKERTGFIIGILGFATALFTSIKLAYSSNDEDMDCCQQRLNRVDKIASGLKNAKVTPTNLTKSTGPIIDRPAVEKLINDAMTQKRPEYFYVVYGSAGVGKSTLLEKVAIGKDATIICRKFSFIS